MVKEVEKFASNGGRFIEAIKQSGNPVLKSKYSFYLESLLGKAIGLREIFRKHSANRKGYLDFRNGFLEIANPDLLAIILQEDEEKAKKQVEDVSKSTEPEFS